MTTPSATGTLDATPLAHALVYARNRRLTGRLELATSDGKQSATLTIWRGSITAVETNPIGMCPGGFFGAVIYELGYIDSDTLDSTLLEISKSKRLHGEVLIERKKITPAQRDEGLVEQIHRKVHHLFSLPETTKYSFYDAKAPPVEPPVAVECVGPVWRGIRDYPPLKFVTETTRRVGTNALRATAGGSARLPPFESALLQQLATRAMTLEEMKASSELPPGRVELLVYLLVIAKCVESVTGERTHPSTGALPVTMPSGPMRSPSGEIRHPSPARGSGGVRISSPAKGMAPARKPASGSISAVKHPSSGSMAAVRPAIGHGSTPRLPAIPGGPLPTPVSAFVTPTLVTLKSPAELGLEGIQARAADITNESYFEALGVPEGASGEAVRAAYMRLAKTWHPDRLVADFVTVRGDVAKIFTYMTKGQQTLCDPDARRAYVAARTSKKTSRTREDVMKDVETALNRRDWEVVADLCAGLVETDSDDAEAMAIHGWATVRGGEATEDELRAVLTKMDKAVNVDRTNENAIYYRGLVHKRLNNIPAAFRDFARALQLGPKHLEAEREVRILAMRVKKGSGEHKLIAPLLEKLDVDVKK